MVGIGRGICSGVFLEEPLIGGGRKKGKDRQAIRRIEYMQGWMYGTGQQRWAGVSQLWEEHVAKEEGRKEGREEGSHARRRKEGTER